MHCPIVVKIYIQTNEPRKTYLVFILNLVKPLDSIYIGARVRWVEKEKEPAFDLEEHAPTETQKKF